MVNLRTRRSRAQASLEMALALMGALLLLFGSLKVWVWASRRMVQRQQAYEQSRVDAGRQTGKVAWNEPSEKLAIFK